MSQPSASSRPAGEAIPHVFDATDFVKVRGTTDGQQVFLVWHGEIYAMLPEERRQHLFSIVGMSVARCLPHSEQGWDFISRELTFYLDPTTQEILHQWHNPWTQNQVTVMHVANNPVQGHFQGQFPAKITGDQVTFQFDLFPQYPNPLAEDPTLAPYSPQPIYQAAELFKLVVPTTDLLGAERSTVSRLTLSWDRIGPWLPWMNMGRQPGQMIYSATGQKVYGFTDLPQLLQEQIDQRVPIYRNAPTSRQPQTDMTSWSYFKQHFSDYLSGEIFPIKQIDEGES
jgi:hypothetical protein